MRLWTVGIVAASLSCSPPTPPSAPPSAAPIAQPRASAETATPPATAPLVRYVGRFDMTDVAGPRFAWAGSSIHARFRGTRLRARITGAPNIYQVVIDGQPTSVLKTDPGKTDIEVARGLADGVHDVILYKRTEALFGSAVFLGFEPAESLLPAAPPSRRQIEIIGDSISNGYGIEGESAHCPFTPETENAYLTYGALAARALQAEERITAWSGRGVFRNYGGDKTDTLPVLFERTIPDDPASHWTFTWPLPDVVVINLGTNDFGQGDPGPGFVTAYETFLARVRAEYSNATIFCALGSMLAEPSVSIARRYIQKVVADAASPRVAFLEFPTQDLAHDGAGCDYHPNVVTQKKMADILVRAIHDKVGW